MYEKRLKYILEVRYLVVIGNYFTAENTSKTFWPLKCACVRTTRFAIGPGIWVRVFVGGFITKLKLRLKYELFYFERKTRWLLK